MCMDCWEYFDSPALDTPDVRMAAKLIAEVYEHSCVGGNLHVVIDDWNVDDIDLVRAEITITENTFGSPPAAISAEWAALVALRGLSDEERASALALHDGFWTT